MLLNGNSAASLPDKVKTTSDWGLLGVIKQDRDIQRDLWETFAVTCYCESLYSEVPRKVKTFFLPENDENKQWMTLAQVDTYLSNLNPLLKAVI